MARAATELLPPAGTSPLQWQLAKQISSGAISWTDAMLKAGYSPATARSDALDIRERPGVRNALEKIQRDKADSARGLVGMAQRLLGDAEAGKDAIDPRDKYAIAVKLMELANTLGLHIEAKGTGHDWKERVRRACRLMARLTERRLSPPLHVDATCDTASATVEK